MKHWLTSTFLFISFFLYSNANELLASSTAFVDHPVSTTNPKAQQYFNEGLTQFFAYNHDVAFIKFEKAAQEDPKCAMAYWGMALSLGQHSNREISPENEKKTFAYSRKALALSSDATPVEQAYIQALSVRYTDDPNRNLLALRRVFCDAMEKLAKRYPEDLDASCLYAQSILYLNPWNYWTLDGKPKEKILEAIEILQSILNRDPDNLAANHFYIHAWEQSPTPERALLSAFRLTSVFHGAHLNHMPCHIFILYGYYADAVSTSKKAIAANQYDIQQYGIDRPHGMSSISHNLKFLARTYMLWGDYKGAIETANELEQFVKPYYQEKVHLSRSLIVPLEVNLYFHRWKEILQIPIPNTTDAYTLAFFHFARAVAFIRLGDLASYQKERDMMADFDNKIPHDDVIANNSPKKIIELKSILLDAQKVKSDGMSYINKLEQAVQIQDSLNYDQPPAWYLPLRLELGEAHLEVKQYEEAEKVFKKGLQEYKRNGRFLEGLYQSLKGQNKDWDAFWVREASKAVSKESLK